MSHQPPSYFYLAFSDIFLKQTICACCCLIFTTSSHHNLASLHQGCWNNAMSRHQCLLSPNSSHCPTSLQMGTPNCPFSSTLKKILYPGFFLSLGILFPSLWHCLPMSTLSKTNLYQSPFPLYCLSWATINLTIILGQMTQNHASLILTLKKNRHTSTEWRKWAFC